MGIHTGTHFRILSQKQIYQKYVTVYDREVRFTSAETGEETDLHFDVAGHPKCDFRCAVVFPFHRYGEGRAGGEVTIIREYCQGTNEMMYCLPTGGFCPERHSSLEACARAELSEEAHLCGGQWERLLPEDHKGIAEMKWSMNRILPFLVIDPEEDTAPGARDVEEQLVMTSLRVDLKEFKRLLRGGNMTLPSVMTSYYALDFLEEHGYL